MTTPSRIQRRTLLAAAAATAALPVAGWAQGQPVRICSTLALTGPLSA